MKFKLRFHLRITLLIIFKCDSQQEAKENRRASSHFHKNVASVSSFVNYDGTMNFPLKFPHFRSILDLRFFVKTIADQRKGGRRQSREHEQN